MRSQDIWSGPPYECNDHRSTTFGEKLWRCSKYPKLYMRQRNHKKMECLCRKKLPTGITNPTDSRASKISDTSIVRIGVLSFTQQQNSYNETASIWSSLTPQPSSITTNSLYLLLAHTTTIVNYNQQPLFDPLNYNKPPLLDPRSHHNHRQLQPTASIWSFELQQTASPWSLLTPQPSSITTKQSLFDPRSHHNHRQLQQTASIWSFQL